AYADTHPGTRANADAHADMAHAGLVRAFEAVTRTAMLQMGFTATARLAPPAFVRATGMRASLFVFATRAATGLMPATASAARVGRAVRAAAAGMAAAAGGVAMFGKRHNRRERDAAREQDAREMPDAEVAKPALPPHGAEPRHRLPPID
ncbi:MAG TPA: hypothetical protein VJY39_02140, partial [Acidisphaera sp.]|nr:hypothetical protein [Acidisphaera sp.]